MNLYAKGALELSIRVKERLSNDDYIFEKTLETIRKQCELGEFSYSFLELPYNVKLRLFNQGFRIIENGGAGSFGIWRRDVIYWGGKPSKGFFNFIDRFSEFKPKT